MNIANDTVVTFHYVLKDENGNELGKATVTGYCIKFETQKAVNSDVLKTAIRDGIEQTRL